MKKQKQSEKILITIIIIMILIGLPLFKIYQDGQSSFGRHSILDIITYPAFDESDCFKDPKVFGNQCIYPIEQAFSVIGKCKRDGWDTCKVMVI